MRILTDRRILILCVTSLAGGAAVACESPLGSDDTVDEGEPGRRTRSETSAAESETPAESKETGAHAEETGDHGGSHPDGCATFSSSYEAIQELIFERKGCTVGTCHGQAKVGGLDLRADASYESLVDVQSANSANARVQPGSAEQSFLYQKLLAATKPGSIQIAGSPMPTGTAPLTEKELEAVRLWIVKGAPKEGTVADQTADVDVGGLLDACLPPAKPVKAKPLEPPAADEGIQFVLPRYQLKANSEVELCTPFAFDFTDRVPAEYKDVARNVMFVNGSRVRQDPQSHHLVMWNPRKPLTSVAANDPKWTCRGGPKEGQRCSARNGSADCGDGGVCAGETVDGALCNLNTTKVTSGKFDGKTIRQVFDFLLTGGLPQQAANTQSPQQYTPPLEGVYTELPLKGIFWFNSHAFNLTNEDTVLEARVNYLFAKDRKREVKPHNVISHLNIAKGQPPFTRKTYCAKWVVPQNISIAIMTGHTHRRGERFWVKDSKGHQIYENFNYNDPVYKHFDPWLDFSSPNSADRTLEYCATYSNGLTKDNKPDLGLVTRASRMPEISRCTPVACTGGKVMAACKADRDCDSAPGANDGDCDACPITPGETTENEMFVLMPWLVLPPKN